MGVDAEEALAFCCFNARLRDYARLALLLANDGGGVIPAGWVREATSAPAICPRAAQGDAVRGYGYQTWLLPSAAACSRCAEFMARRSSSIPAEARAGAHCGAREAEKVGARTQHAVVRAGAPGRAGTGRGNAATVLICNDEGLNAYQLFLKPAVSALLAAVRGLAHGAGDGDLAEHLLFGADPAQPFLVGVDTATTKGAGKPAPFVLRRGRCLHLPGGAKPANLFNDRACHDPR